MKAAEGAMKEEMDFILKRVKKGGTSFQKCFYQWAT
jgi:hypothetical protein